MQKQTCLVAFTSCMSSICHFFQIILLIFLVSHANAGISHEYGRLQLRKKFHIVTPLHTIYYPHTFYTRWNSKRYHNALLFVWCGKHATDQNPVSQVLLFFHLYFSFPTNSFFFAPQLRSTFLAFQGNFSN